MMKRLVALALFLVIGTLLWAERTVELSTGAEVGFDQGEPVASAVVGLWATSDLFDLKAILSGHTDSKYGADIANFKDTHSLFGTYALMEEGYTSVHTDKLLFQIGRIKHHDAYDSPYSLFINSNNPSTVGGVISYHDDIFFYESRWIRLNQDSYLGSEATEAWKSTSGYPNRGANVKTFALTLGDHTFGFQDAGLYTGRSFDLEYFVSPLPEYFTQYFYGTSGRPWSTGANENNLIGFFWKWKQQDFRVGAQVLIDDFSLHFLLPDLVPNNPWKAAWTFGGEWETSYGSFGLHHAGALKYTFEPIDTTKGKEGETAYGYTLYPETQYAVNGSYRAFEIEDNSLGYLHGENNAALLATWSQVFHRTIRVNSQLEFLLAGANSPANPWQDALGSNEVGTHWIDDPVLQKSITLTTEIRWLVQGWELWGNVSLGYVWNALELSAASYADASSTASALDQYVLIYKPSSDNKAVGSLSIGFTYKWDPFAQAAAR